MVAVVWLLKVADRPPPVVDTAPMPVVSATPRLKPGPPVDIVTGESLDPKTSYYRAEFQGTELYFSSQESLDAFRADPLKYVKIKASVKITPVDPP